MPTSLGCWAAIPVSPSGRGPLQGEPPEPSLPVVVLPAAPPVLVPVVAAAPVPVVAAAPPEPVAAVVPVVEVWVEAPWQPRSARAPSVASVQRRGRASIA